MERYLMILEVSQKQAYIFASRKLRDNLLRSEEIRFVTSPEFFKACCPDAYTDDNLVYVGGGHTVLQFADPARARSFAAAVTERVLRQFPEMELFVKLRHYDEEKTAGENLTLLSAALEEKKARRRASFARRSFGIDAEQKPVVSYPAIPLPVNRAPAGWQLTNDGERLAGADNFLAVVHIDGNAMGARVQEIYRTAGNDWDACVAKLRQFSQSIDTHFSQAYNEMTAELAAVLPSLGWDAQAHAFPVRKVIGAGDDVCFLTAGSLGLDCAVSFIRHLNGKRNDADGKGYAACAGVVIVHKKYPFRTAYDLSEALCSNAKAFGASIDKTGGISAIDWHIEFGQLKDSLSKIREDYVTDDGARLVMRPYAVSGSGVPAERQYDFFAAVLSQLRDCSKKLPRSKVKSLREAFKQGELETRLALRSSNMEELLYVGIEARSSDWLERAWKEGKLVKEVFYTDPEGVRRCLYFDAIEVMDHTTLWREEP